MQIGAHRFFYHPNSTGGTNGVKPPEDSGRPGDGEPLSFPIELMQKHLTPQASKAYLEKMTPYTAEALRDVHLENFQRGKFWNSMHNFPSKGDHMPWEQTTPRLAMIHHLPYLVAEFKKEGVYETFRTNLLHTLSMLPLFTFTNNDLTNGLSLIVGLQKELNSNVYPHKEEIKELLDSIIKGQIVYSAQIHSSDSFNLDKVKNFLLDEITEPGLAQEVKTNLRKVLGDFNLITANLNDLVVEIRIEVAKFHRKSEQVKAAGKTSPQQILITQNQKVLDKLFINLIPKNETELSTWFNPTTTILEKANSSNSVFLGSSAQIDSDQEYFNGNGQPTSYYAYLLNLLGEFSIKSEFKTWVISAQYLSDILLPLVGSLNDHSGLSRDFTDTLEQRLNENLEQYFSKDNRVELDFGNYLGLTNKFKEESSNEIKDSLAFIRTLKEKTLNTNKTIEIKIVKDNQDLYLPIQSANENNKFLFLHTNNSLGDFISISEEIDHPRDNLFLVSLHPQYQKSKPNSLSDGKIVDIALVSIVQNNIIRSGFSTGKDNSVASAIRENPEIDTLFPETFAGNRRETPDLVVTTIERRGPDSDNTKVRPPQPSVLLNT